MSGQSTAERLGALPRFKVAALPTPLDQAPRLSQLLGVHLLTKRDDLTGLALGGNKARKLEFLIGDALAERATLILTTAAVQSNFCRMTAAAAARAGLAVGLLLRGEATASVQGNLLLDRLLGAEIRFTDHLDPYAPVHRAQLQAWCEEELARGGTPYPIYLHDGSRAGALATAGYVAAAAELDQQCGERGIQPDHLYLAAGSGATLAGLLLGAHRSGSVLAGTRIVGVCAGALSADLAPRVRTFISSAAELLDLPELAAPIVLDDSQRGSAYGVPTQVALDAILVASRTEALMLNPVYTGKAFAALLADIDRGVVRSGETVIFLNTGGDPLLFSYADTLAAAAADREMLPALLDGRVGAGPGARRR